MVSKPANLRNLLATGVLHGHQPSLVELETHLSLARDALHDAGLKETSASGRFIGFVGRHVPSDELPFSPCVEVGWRLTKPYWGLGYATEAAQSAISFGFQQLRLAELVAFTAVANLKSRAVMERLGMQFDSEFDHPQVPVESRLRRHVLYRLRSLV